MNRDRFTVLSGVVLVAAGVLWMLDMAAGLEIPWEWVLPSALVVIGLVLVFARSDGGGGGSAKPPSQFERDDAPRVP